MMENQQGDAFEWAVYASKNTGKHFWQGEWSITNLKESVYLHVMQISCKASKVLINHETF